MKVYKEVLEERIKYECGKMNDEVLGEKVKQLEADIKDLKQGQLIRITK